MNTKAVLASIASVVSCEATEFFRLEGSVSPEVMCQGLIRELLESDTEYFCAAAHCETLPGCQLVHMSGLEALAAGCVVQKISCENNGDFSRRLQAVEARLLGLGCTHARFYQQYPDNRLEQNFIQHGYRPVAEIALLNTFHTRIALDNETEEVQLRPVRSERDWSLKLSLHRDTSQDPDGHSSPADSWLDMERRKCEVGYMEPFLIYCQDQPCGSVNLSLSGRLGRLKNLVIHPQWRRRGIGVEAARLIACLAQYHGKVAAGCFAINNEPSLALYKSAGYKPVTRQIEWFKRFT